ncbi:MAG: cyclic nucleotide-binding domain-containing protein [Thermodesulfobacteriota bacterium]
MVRSFLVMQRGLLEERVFPVYGQVSIGRSPGNVIQMLDPSVSRRHAIVYSTGEKTVVEDLGSQNGTFVNGERVQKAFLTKGDILRVGNSLLRFVQEEVRQDEDGGPTQELFLGGTQDLSEKADEEDQPRILVSDAAAGASLKSRRLLDVLSRVTVFSGLDRKALMLLVEKAHLLVLDRGRTVFQEGDRGRSLFVILDGKVRILTHDRKGKELSIAGLSQNDFFGELSFLTGSPRGVTARVEEEAMLCELSYDSMAEVIEMEPSLQGVLDRHCAERTRQVEAAKRAAGLIERRRHPRFNEKLPVSFQVSAVGSRASHLRGRLFRSVSHDVSLLGIRIKVQERALMELPLGSQLRLDISLPHPWGAIHCLGTIRDVVEGKEGQDVGFLGIEFSEMSPAHRTKIRRFLSDWNPSARRSASS